MYSQSSNSRLWVSGVRQEEQPLGCLSLKAGVCTCLCSPIRLLITVPCLTLLNFRHWCHLLIRWCVLNNGIVIMGEDFETIVIPLRVWPFPPVWGAWGLSTSVDATHHYNHLTTPLNTASCWPETRTFSGKHLLILLSLILTSVWCNLVAKCRTLVLVAVVQSVNYLVYIVYLIRVRGYTEVLSADQRGRRSGEVLGRTVCNTTQPGNKAELDRLKRMWSADLSCRV